MFPRLERTNSEMQWADSAKGVSESLFEKARLIFKDATRIQNECEKLKESLDSHVEAVGSAKCHFVDKDEIIAINTNIAKLLAGISVQIDEFAGQDDSQIAAAKELDLYIQSLDEELDKHEGNQTRPDVPLLESIFNASLPNPEGPVNERAAQKILSCAISVQRSARKRLEALVHRAHNIANKATATIAKSNLSSDESPRTRSNSISPAEVQDKPVGQAEESDSQDETNSSPQLQVKIPHASEETPAFASPLDTNDISRRKRGRRGRRRRKHTDVPIEEASPVRSVTNPPIRVEAGQMNEIGADRGLSGMEQPTPKEIAIHVAAPTATMDTGEAVRPPPVPNASRATISVAETQAPRAYAVATIPRQEQMESKSPCTSIFRSSATVDNQAKAHGLTDRETRSAVELRRGHQEENIRNHDEEEERQEYYFRSPFVNPSRFYNDYSDAIHPVHYRVARPQASATAPRSERVTMERPRRPMHSGRRFFEEDMIPVSPFEYFAPNPLAFRFRQPAQYSMMHPFFYSRG